MVAASERYERVAAAFGVEARQPLLDKRVVEFFLNLPREQKIRHGWTKYLLRRAAEECLPAEVAWREGKEHIGSVFHQEFAKLSSCDVSAGSMTSTNCYRDSRVLVPESRVTGNAQALLAAESNNLIDWLNRIS